MKIGIIGGGAIGLLLAHKLNEKHDVTLFVRRKSQQLQIENNGIHIANRSSTEEIQKVKTALIEQLDAADIYIVCVKQPSLPSIYQQLAMKEIVSPVLFLQNGMGHLEEIARLSMEVYVGIVEHGAKKENDFTVSHLGNGSIQISCVTSSASRVQDFISQVHTEAFPIYYLKQVEPLLKAKLIVNAVINPLTAIFNIDNGDVLTNHHFRLLAKALCAEAASVLQLEEEQAWNHIVSVAEKTAKNTSSMRADILQGRQTEIEAISGYILAQTTKQLPYTTFVYEAVLGLTAQRGRKQ